MQAFLPPLGTRRRCVIIATMFKRVQYCNVPGVRCDSSQNVYQIDIQSSLRYPLKDSIGNLINLTRLNLRNGSSYLVPFTIGKLKKLEYLDLSCSNLTTIPSYLGDFILTLSATNMRGTANLTNLQELHLTSAQLGVDDDTTFHDSSSGGSIPDEFFNLTQLRVLKLNDNLGLGGSLSRLVNKLQSLEVLDFGSTSIGPIPQEICQCENLNTLSFGSTNQKNNSLLSCIGNLTHLSQLNLATSGFVGQIPAGYGDPSFIIILIHSLLANLINLSSLNLGSNNLTGDIPPAFCNQLIEFDNRLTLWQLIWSISKRFILTPTT